MRRVKENSQPPFIVKISKHRLLAMTCSIRPIDLYQGLEESIPVTYIDDRYVYLKVHGYIVFADSNTDWLIRGRNVFRSEEGQLPIIEHADVGESRTALIS